MKDLLEYKGYWGSVNYSAEDNVLWGKVEGIRSLITFEGTTIQELIDGFHYMIDDYLEDCKIKGKTPEKPYKGSFHVRVNPNLHYKATVIAEKEGKSLNKIVNEALEKYVA